MMLSYVNKHFLLNANYVTPAAANPSPTAELGEAKK